MGLLLLGTCVLTAFSHSLRQLCLRKTEWEQLAGLLVWPRSLRHLCASQSACANTLVLALCAQSLCREGRLRPARDRGKEEERPEERSRRSEKKRRVNRQYRKEGKGNTQAG